MLFIFAVLSILFNYPALSQENEALILETFEDQITDNTTYQAEAMGSIVDAGNESISLNGAVQQEDLTDIAQKFQDIQGTSANIQNLHQAWENSARDSYHNTLTEVNTRLDKLATTQQHSQTINQEATSIRTAIRTGNISAHKSKFPTLSNNATGSQNIPHKAVNSTSSANTSSISTTNPLEKRDTAVKNTNNVKTVAKGKAKTDKKNVSATAQKTNTSNKVNNKPPTTQKKGNAKNKSSPDKKPSSENNQQPV